MKDLNYPCIDCYIHLLQERQRPDRFQLQMYKKRLCIRGWINKNVCFIERKRVLTSCNCLLLPRKGHSFRAYQYPMCSFRPIENIRKGPRTFPCRLEEKSFSTYSLLPKTSDLVLSKLFDIISALWWLEMCRTIQLSYAATDCFPADYNIAFSTVPVKTANKHWQPSN